MLGSEGSAAAISFDGGCWPQVEKSGYLIRGDHESKAVGARLWNLDALSRDWNHEGSGSNSCTSQVYKQAIKDQAEYWNSIGKKYKCSSSGDAAPNTPCGRFAENRAYLGFMGAIVATAAPSSPAPAPSAGGKVPVAHAEIKTLDCKKEDTSFLHTVSGLAKDVAKAVIPSNLFYHDPAACEKLNIPADQKRDPKEKWLSPSAIKIPTDCLKGIVNQLMTELRGITSLAKSWWKTGFFTGIANVARAIADDPVAVVTRFFENTWKYFTEDFDDFLCFNQATRVEKVCKATTKGVLTYLTGKAVNPAFAWGGKQVSRVSGAVRKAVWDPVKGAVVARVVVPAAKVANKVVLDPVAEHVVNPARTAASKAVAPVKKVAQAAVDKVKRKKPQSAEEAALAAAENGVEAQAMAAAAKTAAQRAEKIEPTWNESARPVEAPGTDLEALVPPEARLSSGAAAEGAGAGAGAVGGAWDAAKAGGKAAAHGFGKAKRFVGRTVRNSQLGVKAERQDQENQAAPSIENALKKRREDQLRREAEEKANPRPKQEEAPQQDAAPQQDEDQASQAVGRDQESGAGQGNAGPASEGQSEDGEPGDHRTLQEKLGVQINLGLPPAAPAQR